MQQGNKNNKITRTRTTNECKQKSCHTKNFHNFSLGICSIIFLNSSFCFALFLLLLLLLLLLWRVVVAVALNVNGRAVQHGGIQHTYMRQDVLNMRAELPALQIIRPMRSRGEAVDDRRQAGMARKTGGGGGGRLAGGMSGCLFLSVAVSVSASVSPAALKCIHCKN